MLKAEAGGGGIADIAAAERPAPPAPGPGEVSLDMLAMSINPADLLMMQGLYGVKPEPPFTPGAEGVARVREIGDSVEGLAPGDLVMPFDGQAWVARMTVKASRVVKLPADADLDQAAMLKANPATALAMLRDLVSLSPGDWVAQNAANSAVGINVIRLAPSLGLKTVNVVRREAAAERLRALGADRVLVHDGTGPAPALPEGIAPKLAFDAIGGPATNLLAGMLAEGGTIANYGLLSGRPCEVDAHHLVFRDLTLRGFWLSKWFRDAGPAKVAETYALLVARLKTGEIGAPVLARYPLSQVKDAVAHAAQEGREGKILLLGPEHPEA